MYPTIRVYVNGEYAFTTRSYPSCKILLKEIRCTKHLSIAIPGGFRHLTVYDYDNVECRRMKK